MSGERSTLKPRICPHSRIPNPQPAGKQLSIFRTQSRHLRRPKVWLSKVSMRRYSYIIRIDSVVIIIVRVKHFQVSASIASLRFIYDVHEKISNPAHVPARAMTSRLTHYSGQLHIGRALTPEIPQAARHLRQRCAKAGAWLLGR